ncbi:penicillin-binding transpeptidase domain-containing protein [Sphingomonas lacusdianchii]|uniref:penicillin-binding transpeptidase domain-containing protein n=1 Tax=Sphingomonas lacusdianchii TaxID=2917992 RepID=UPI001F56D7CA|nr:penicillin-binding transpeptidase domain-containing protein [Sphingomonas sp. JXJ CY 53]
MTRRSKSIRPLLALGIAVVASSCTPTALSHSSSLVQSAEARGCDQLPPGSAATMVIFEPAADKMLTCNPARAQTRFVPASTYKIAHTLIALETGAISSIRERFAWDKRDRGLPAWNHNIDVAGAVSASAVWVFQAIAARIGFEKEAEWVRTLDYGNEMIGNASNLKHFWLSGPLKISAVEQVDFLYRLNTRRLPASADAVQGTLEAMALGRTADGNRVYGKTGAMLPIDDEGFLRPDSTGLLPSGEERTGWFVGWIDRSRQDGGPVYFALNLDLALPDAMAARTRITYEILQANGVAVPD